MTEQEYREKVRLELLSQRDDNQAGFRDAVGFIVDYTAGSPDSPGKPDTLGEGSLHTAIAAVAIATGNFHQDSWEVAEANDRLDELLKTLRERGWGNQDGLGRLHPIRHPGLSEYNLAGTAFRKSPLTKDGFGAILAACYYAYKCPHSSDAVRSSSVALIQKWIEYLVFFQWRTHSTFIPGEFETIRRGDLDSQATGKKADEGVFRHIYSAPTKDDGTPLPVSQRLVMAKGPESFTLFPHEIYALQNVGTALGQPTSHWNVWAQGMGPALKQTIIDIIAPYIGELCKRAMSAILDKLKIGIPYSIPLGAPGWNFGKLEGVFAIGIPSNVRMGIATSFGDAIRDIIREFVRLDTLQHEQASQVLGLAVSRILDLLPKALGPDKWRSILTLGMRQISPWLDGSIWVEAVTFAATLQILKKQPTFVQSYTVWTFAVTFETRPDLADLLRPLVQEFFSALRGQGNPIGMWAWLAEDTGRVNDHLTTFVASSPYRWPKFAYGSTAYGDWLSDIVSEPEEIDGKPNPENPQSPRLDYLVLQGLHEKGPPKGITDVVQNWLEMFREAVQQLFENFIASAKQMVEQLGIAAVEGLSKASFHADTPLIPPVLIHGDAGHGDAHGDIGHGDAHGDAGHGDAHGDVGHGDAHGDTGHGDFHGDAGHGDAHGDIAHGDAHGDSFLGSFHTDTGLGVHLDTSLSGAHGDSGVVNLHGDTGDLGVHGDSPSVGVHGDSQSVGVHGDSPSVGLHGDTPEVGHLDSHGDVGNGGHIDSPIIPPVKLSGTIPHGDAHGDAGHGDMHGDAGHGDAHGDAGHGDFHGDVGHGDAHSDVGHGDAHGDVGHGLGGPHADWGGQGVHGDFGGFGLHGDSPGVGVHADATAVGLHADSPSVGVHGDSPPNDLHVDFPGFGHGDVHIDRAPEEPEPTASQSDAPLPIHADFHQDVGGQQHGDSHGDAHIDAPHEDSAAPLHFDTHLDSPFVDVHADTNAPAHGDAHGDLGHGDAHGDVHIDGPPPTHLDAHLDVAGPPHGDMHGDTSVPTPHTDGPAPVHQDAAPTLKRPSPTTGPHKGRKSSGHD
jgi:hypothetical protein